MNVPRDIPLAWQQLASNLDDAEEQSPAVPRRFRAIFISDCHLGTPGCQAGLRFLVVTADGMLQPCSMQFQKYPLEKQAAMVREFSATNTCDQCYVSIRSYLDKSFPRLLWENVSGFLSIKPRLEPPAEA